MRRPLVQVPLLRSSRTDPDDDFDDSDHFDDDRNDDADTGVDDDVDTMMIQILMKFHLPNQSQIVEADHLVCLVRHLVDVSEPIIIIIIAIVIGNVIVIVMVIICYLPFNSIITAIRPVGVASHMACEDVLDRTNLSCW